VVLLELVVSPSIELARPFSTETRDFKRVARTPVRTITMLILERVIGSLAQKETGMTGILAAVALSKLMKMCERNTGQKSENNQKEQTRSLPNRQMEAENEAAPPFRSSFPK